MEDVINSNYVPLVSHTECLANYQWTINEFFDNMESPEHILQMDNDIYSPSFMRLDRKWKLQLRTNAKKDGTSSGLFLTLYGDLLEKQDLLVEFSFTLFSSQRKEPFLRRQLKKNFSDGKGHGILLFTKQKVLEKKNQLMLEKDLVINFEINDCTLIETKSNHSEIMIKLLNNKKNADLEIYGQDGGKFHAHRMFLRMYSDVLGYMTDNDFFMEGKSKKLVINDPPEAIKVLLQFIYTGVRPIFENEEIAYVVLDQAERYNIELLKNYCFKYLEESCEVKNVLKILITADIYDGQELKNYALNFIDKNYKSVVKIQSFSEFPANRYDLLKDILLRIAN